MSRFGRDIAFEEENPFFGRCLECGAEYPIDVLMLGCCPVCLGLEEPEEA